MSSYCFGCLAQKIKNLENELNNDENIKKIKNLENELNNKTNENNENIKKIDEHKSLIEKLENENKILKDEINNSKNKLQLLEDKINKLLLGKNKDISEKEECPQPTPYVKKYSDYIFPNSNSNFI